MNALPDWTGKKSLVWQELWRFIWFELNSDNNNFWLGGVWKESLNLSSETFLSLTLNKSYDWVLSEEKKEFKSFSRASCPFQSLFPFKIIFRVNRRGESQQDTHLHRNAHLWVSHSIKTHIINKDLVLSVSVDKALHVHRITEYSQLEGTLQDPLWSEWSINCLIYRAIWWGKVLNTGKAIALLKLDICSCPGNKNL